MMDQIFEHIMSVKNIPAEIERKKQELAERKKMKQKLFLLLGEMVETEGAMFRIWSRLATTTFLSQDPGREV